jgi:HEAT repeat protein
MKPRAKTYLMAGAFVGGALLSGGSPMGLEAQSVTGSDAARAELLLANARGANPVMCELAMRSIDNRYGSWGSAGRAPDAIIGQRPLLEWASAEIEDAGVVPVLGAALSDSDVCVRRMAARLLGRVNHRSALTMLKSRLEDGDERTGQMAAIGLGYADNRDAVETLLGALEDGVAAVRAAATWALGEIEDERAVDALTRLLAEDSDPTVRRQAAWALGNMY